MGGSKKLKLSWTGHLPILFILLGIFFKQIENAVHQGKCSGRSPLAPPLNLPMIKPKEQFTICTYMYTQYRSVVHVRERLYPMGGYVAGQN